MAEDPTPDTIGRIGRVTPHVLRLLGVETVQLSVEQPELLEDIPADQREHAASAAVVGVLIFPTGPWKDDDRIGERPGHFGLLVLDGLVTRRVHLGGRSCVELLGAGDVLRPWISHEDDGSVFMHATWGVHSTLRVAVLDRAFATRMARYPEVAAAIMDRQIRRARWLTFHLAVCQLPSLQTRLRVTFWYLADRWGRVTSDGVVLPLRLTHELIGGLVGARRPAVTTALGGLSAQGVIVRREDGGWLLAGEPPIDVVGPQGRAAA